MLQSEVCTQLTFAEFRIFGSSDMELNIEPSDRILNASTLRQLVSEIGPRTVEIVIKKSISDLKALFYEVGPAIGLQDWDALRLAVHSIAGVSAVIGGERLRHISLQVEQNCVDDAIAEALVNAAGVMLEIMALIEKLEKLQFDEPTHDFVQDSSQRFQFLELLRTEFA
jgi:HPt (histidine-containing phosphotransfer) domain-containing protein